MPITPEQALALRKPFPAESVGKLPKPVRSQDPDKGKCVAGSKYSTDGQYCGGYHARSMHLDYVGHAATTDRLLTVDPEWSWEPFALDDAGLPALDRGGNLWIRLTICGTTRIGVGDGKSAKECIGDAIRNAAMRFGVALDLWAKEDLVEFAQAAAHRQQPATSPTSPASPRSAPSPVDITASLDGEVMVTSDQTHELAALMSALNLTKPAILKLAREITGRTIKGSTDMTEIEADLVIADLRSKAEAAARAPLGAPDEIQETA